MKHKPDIYYFNPSCEMAVANNTVAFSPNKRIQLFEESLESIMHIFADEEDVVLMRRLPDAEFLDFYKRNNLSLPQFKHIEKNDLSFSNLGNLNPWGWSPVAHRLLKPYKKGANNGSATFVIGWQSDYRKLYSRETALHILKQILSANKELPLVPDILLPVKCTSIEEVKGLLNRYGKGVVKAPWSSSGRGIQMLRRAEITSPFKEWLTGILKQQGYVMFEQMLEVEHNVGLQFEIINGRVVFLGYSFFYVSSNGQYQGNTVNLNIDHLPNHVSQLFKDGTYDKLVSRLIDILQLSEIAQVYQGVLGIDTLIIKQDNNTLIQPCLEINLRYTMGHVALSLEKYISNETSGKFEIWFDQKKTFGEFVKAQEATFPLLIENQRITSGFLPLSSYWDAPIGSYLLVQ